MNSRGVPLFGSVELLETLFGRSVPKLSQGQGLMIELLLWPIIGTDANRVLDPAFNSAGD